MGQHKIKGASTGAYTERQALKQTLANLMAKARKSMGLLEAYFQPSTTIYPAYHPQLKTTSEKGKGRSWKEKRIRRAKHRQKMRNA